jgi:hypothetical protein
MTGSFPAAMEPSDAIAWFSEEHQYGLVSLRGLLVKYAHFFFINGDMLRAAISSLAHIADRLAARGNNRPKRVTSEMFETS